MELVFRSCAGGARKIINRFSPRPKSEKIVCAKKSPSTNSVKQRRGGSFHLSGGSDTPPDAGNRKGNRCEVIPPVRWRFISGILEGKR